MRASKKARLPNLRMYPELDPNDFAEFCEAAHDFAPYPWQMRLARSVFEHGLWPEKLSLPCTAGRCAIADIAMFHLALQAKAIAPRKAPLRIVHVLDRWTIQNSFFVHSLQLAERLQRSLHSPNQGHILARV